MMKLSVIIITWNSEKDVVPCINSVLDSTRHLISEIVVVDNGSEDATFEKLKDFGDKLHLLRNNRNEGVAKARNKALKAARGEYLWILDIDTLVNRAAVDQMLKYLEENKDVGLCGCKLTSLQGDIQDSCRKIPSLRFKFLNALLAIDDKYGIIKPLRKKIELINENQFYHKKIKGNTPFQVGYVIGACQVFHRAIIKEVGYLDENIFYGPEDADFCLRITRAGWKIVYLPEVSVVHHYLRMTTKQIFSKMTFIHLWAVIYFSIKQKRIWIS